MPNDLEFEANFWGQCLNTFDEEQKHYVYAPCMEIPVVGYSFDGQNKSIIDIGGGPVSMLLKTINKKCGKVVDPLPYPEWVSERYKAAKIHLLRKRGEDLNALNFDEAWIYNCLQHVDDVAKIIANAKKAAKVIRLFEWIDIPAYPGHPQQLTEQLFTDLLGPGNTAEFNSNGCYGRAFFGKFTT
ncbi:hypothetical protein EBR96_10935 [bacterium]|nr:hypothetical protein [bacterium]